MKRNEDLSDSDGVELVKMARRAVTEFLENNSKINDGTFNSKFDLITGVFVTLNKRDSLRGCIGYPLPVRKLSEGLIDAAISAATQDTRFNPVTVDELDNIIFEVTVLTPPVEIKVDEPSEYLKKINVGKDGLMVEKEYASGLLLPQVPTEYGWNAEEFLEYACQKAGLEKNAWKDRDTKISKFQGIIFKEESPSGKIMRII